MGFPRKALVSTIKPGDGGVPVMVRVMCDTLRGGGIEPVIAHYEPYSLSPALSVPMHRLLGRRPGTQQTTALDGCECHAIGAWLPELEFTHYHPTQTWQRLIDAADVHVVASGNCLAGTAFAALDVPFLGWIATPWDEDRRLRASRFPAHRRLLDRVVNAPIIRRLERDILSRGHIVALSAHTRRQIEALVPTGRRIGYLPAPVDYEWLEPKPAAVVRGRIGFAGRYNDPRKNVTLLIDALERLTPHGAFTLSLAGDEPAAPLLQRCAASLESARIRLLPQLDRRRYREFLQTLDVFVVPSDQEGLCIAALEAMACGCPVVSTRCGGPEEFVIDGETGFLTDPEAPELTARIREIVEDRALRARLGANARQLVLERYTTSSFRQTFWNAFRAAFAAEPAAAVV